MTTIPQSSPSLNYFDVEHATATQAMIIQKSGGFMTGVTNPGGLEAVLGHMQNDDYYPEFCDKMAYLVYGLNKNHCFHDGNKRSSIALSSYFLELNGFDQLVVDYTRGMEEVVIWVAKSLIDQEQLKAIIETLLFADELKIAAFIAESKRFRPFIEPENNPIDKELLGDMVAAWLSDSMEFSDDLKARVAVALLSSNTGQAEPEEGA